MAISILSAAILSGLLLAGHAAALDPIKIKGTKFFYENGTQFYIKGVAYQQNTGAAGGGVKGTKFADPLANEAACRRDVPNLVKLGTNTIRTYAIDPKANHDVCMGLLEDAGIYVISDLGEPYNSIETDTPQWNVPIFNRYKAVIDELGKYTNTIGFFAGNEVTNNATNTPASAYVKAAVRDTKKYIKEKMNRPMYVGYAANDDKDIRVEIAHYFNCGDVDEAIDFWGYNIYQWCGENTIKGSGYGDQIDFFRNYSVPVFFAEYGCKDVPGGGDGRKWQETTALYSDEMTSVFSGGIVYMYFEEENDYGLVNLDGNTAKPMENFEALASRVAEASPSSIGFNDYKPTNSPQDCPAVAGPWQASNVLPPEVDSATCDCMFKQISCAPKQGLKQDDYKPIFDYVCGTKGNPCAGIYTNATTGVHGAYSMCKAEHKLGYVIDKYYKDQGSQKGDCDHEGKAVVVKPSSVDSDCQKRLQSASAVNSVAATATKGAKDGGKDDDSAARPMGIDGLFSVGGFAVATYLCVAAAAGAGMVLL